MSVTLECEESLVDLVDQVGLDDVRQDGVALHGDPLEVALEIGKGFGGSRRAAARALSCGLASSAWLIGRNCREPAGGVVGRWAAAGPGGNRPWW